MSADAADTADAAGVTTTKPLYPPYVLRTGDTINKNYTSLGLQTV